MKFDKFNTMVIALLPAVIMVVALAFGLMFHANVCCGELVQCPNCKATVDTSTNSYHYSVVRRSYGSSGGYSYGSSGGTATPTQVMVGGTAVLHAAVGHDFWYDPFVDPNPWWEQIVRGPASVGDKARAIKSYVYIDGQPVWFNDDSTLPNGGYVYIDGQPRWVMKSSAATPTQVMELPRPKQVIQKIRSLLNRSQGSSGGYSYGSAGGTQLPVATPKAAAEPGTSKKQ